MNASFWAGRRVFLTGHTGFKGGWLSLWLQSLGAQLTGYSLAPIAGPNLFEVAGVGAGMHSIIGDIRDLSDLKKAMHVAAPEIVIHMAAQALVRQSYDAPLETYAVNVMGTANVLEAVRSTPTVCAVISVTTDKCYDNREWHWGYRENEPLGGHDPYSSSKACAELVTAAYRRSFLNSSGDNGQRVAVASVRAGNVIGGGDWSQDRLIPDILRAVAHGQPVQIRNPNAIRPWQFVLEPLAGYLTLAERLASDAGSDFAEAWNFGPADEDARPVRWIVEHLLQRWQGSSQWVQDDKPQPHEANYLKLDCSKARARLGWSPRYNLGDTLDAITDWQRAYLDGADMNATTLAHIARYTESAGS